jgi:hypothetical protein
MRQLIDGIPPRISPVPLTGRTARTSTLSPFQGAPYPAAGFIPQGRTQHARACRNRGTVFSITPRLERESRSSLAEPRRSTLLASWQHTRQRLFYTALFSCACVVHPCRRKPVLARPSVGHRRNEPELCLTCIACSTLATPPAPQTSVGSKEEERLVLSPTCQAGPRALTS